MWAKHQQHAGFTIVELLIVIVVIGILAAITVVAYNGVQQRAKDAELQTSLANAAKQMHVSYATNGVFPSTIPPDANLPSGVGMSLSSTGNAQTFCINAQIQSGSDITRAYYDSGVGQQQSGVCSGSVISGSETGTTSANIVSNPEFTSGWSMGLSVAGQPMTTRAGAAGDPYPTKPVLVWDNSVARTTSWAIVLGGVKYGQVLSGQTYQMTYWIRKTGTGYNGTSNVFGVMDGGTTNKAINVGATSAVNGTWTKVTGTATAIGNGVASNSIYISLSQTYFATTGWGLEFQGFELYKL